MNFSQKTKTKTRQLTKRKYTPTTDKGTSTQIGNADTATPSINQSINRLYFKRVALQPEEKIKNVEKAIQALKRHTDKGTCPVSLGYTARANIAADKDFREDVKRIRKYSESEYVKALTRFHYRDIDRHRAELHRSKRPRVQNKASTRRKECECECECQEYH